MKQLVLTTILTALSFVNLIAQTDNLTYRYFFKADSTYIIIDDSKDNWFTLEIKADTLSHYVDDTFFYDNKKILQINVIPISELLPDQKISVTIPKVLQAYKKWELDYQQKELKTKLKSGEEFYYRDNKPFLIWWYKNPPGTKKTSELNGIVYDNITGTFVDVKTINVTHMLCLNFTIYSKRNVAFTIPVFEDENLQEEIEELKEVANSLRVYGGNIDLGVLVDIKKSKEKYILRDSLNCIEFEVPDWLNIIQPRYDNMFGATFPEKHGVVNAMIISWEYKSDSVSFNDFINRSKLPYNYRPNYRLIEKSDSTLKYFYTSDNSWFHQQNVYLKGDNIYCLINFTATENTYEYNIGRFEEILKNIKLK